MTTIRDVLVKWLQHPELCDFDEIGCATAFIAKFGVALTDLGDMDNLEDWEKFTGLVDYAQQRLDDSYEIEKINVHTDHD